MAIHAYIPLRFPPLLRPLRHRPPRSSSFPLCRPTSVRLHLRVCSSRRIGLPQPSENNNDDNNDGNKTAEEKGRGRKKKERRSAARRNEKAGSGVLFPYFMKIKTARREERRGRGEGRELREKRDDFCYVVAFLRRKVAGPP